MQTGGAEVASTLRTTPVERDNTRPVGVAGGCRLAHPFANIRTTAALFSSY
ncbi:MAG: hypothetical protein JNM76_03600 [Betaproteobacteria bacterium]|nr:hypothetical protein [Betaproteobacteria bacterium]